MLFGDIRLKSGTIQVFEPAGAVEIEGFGIVWPAVAVTRAITRGISTLVAFAACPAADSRAARGQE